MPNYIDKDKDIYNDKDKGKNKDNTVNIIKYIECDSVLIDDLIYFYVHYLRNRRNMLYRCDECYASKISSLH